VNPLLGSAYAKLHEELTSRVGEAVWPTPDAGFLKYVFRNAPASLQLDARPTNVRLSEAPVLASNGFLFGLEPESVSRAIGTEWARALGRLLQRDPFPIDRESYFFRPLEILGICIGAKSCPLVGNDAKDRLRTILEGGTSRIAESDFWSHCITSLAAWQLGLHWKRRSMPLFETLPLDELCLVHWLAKQGEFLKQVGLDSSTEALEQNILSSCFVKLNSIGTPGGAGITLLASEELMEKRISSALEKKWPAPVNTLAAENLVGTICRRFPAFAKQLLSRHASRSTVEILDEYDVQDLFHALLKLHFEDVRSEEWTPSYAGSSTRMDFLLKREQIVVEVKMTRKGLQQKEVLRELTEDIERYRKHPDCKTLICFVYDPGRLCENSVGLEDDLTGTRGALRVVVHVAPRA